MKSADCLEFSEIGQVVGKPWLAVGMAGHGQTDRLTDEQMDTPTNKIWRLV